VFCVSLIVNLIQLESSIKYLQNDSLQLENSPEFESRGSNWSRELAHFLLFNLARLGHFLLFNLARLGHFLLLNLDRLAHFLLFNLARLEFDLDFGIPVPYHWQNGTVERNSTPHASLSWQTRRRTGIGRNWTIKKGEEKLQFKFRFQCRFNFKSQVRLRLKGWDPENGNNNTIFELQFSFIFLYKSILTILNIQYNLILYKIHKKQEKNWSKFKPH